MPMIQTDSQHYSDIADAIRDMSGTQNTYYPADMADAIREIPTRKIYGMIIKSNVSNSSSIIEYIEDSVGMTPAHMDYNTDIFDYGSWENVWFIKNCKPCILNQDGTVRIYLDKNNYAKDIDGNDVIINSSLQNANVMIEFPKIWYKVVPITPSSAKIYFSEVQIDKDYKDYAYIDYTGTHKDHFYMPAYRGSLINNTLRSVSGQSLLNNKTLSQELSYISANGNGWYLETLGQTTLINLLLFLIGKSTNTQYVFGNGDIGGGSTITGQGNTKGLFWGSNANNKIVKIFGIEGWWGTLWRRIAGYIYVSGKHKIKMCNSREDGSATDLYNSDGNGYIESDVPGVNGSSGNYITHVMFSNNAIIPYKLGGSESTYFCDGCFYSSGTGYAIRGGPNNSWHGNKCGAMYYSLDFTVNNTSVEVGSSMSYI